MLDADLLRLMLHARAPNEGRLELARDCPVQFVAEVFDAGAAAVEHNGRAVVGKLALRLRVDPHQVEIDPHHLQQIVEVPVVVGGDGHAVRNLVDHVQLLDADLIDLVEQVDARDVNPVALDDVDEVVGRRVVLEHDVRVVDLVLAQNRLHRVQIQLRLGHRRVQVDSAFVLLLEVDVGWLLVEPQAETFQLVFQQLLVMQRLQHIQHHEDQVACSSHCDDLPTSTLAVFGALDDSRQIQQLDLRAFVFDTAGDGRQRCELVSRHFRVNAS